ncbi:NADH-quinone oxidoreductase subunit N [Buchnera aphidicola (Phyllaphis fagi)]|uniref:NADH-quinone oxidoreductase subunit N n=1 Tax=Buchnera aphidicola TaxID=9 RepID=UPI003463FB27
MFIPIEQIIVLIPFLVLIISISIIMLSIILYRSHVFVFLCTFLSFIISLLSLLIIYKIIPIYITSLIYINFYSIVYIAMLLFSGLCISILSFFCLHNMIAYKEEFYLLILASILGGILLISSNHMISFFIGIELMSLPIIGLIKYSYNQKKSLIIALKYIILSSMFSILMLFGVVLVYSVCGNLNFNNIKISFLINHDKNNQILLFGLGILLISLFFKLSIFPFHFLIPEMYKNISPLILIYFTTIIKVAVFSILIKLFFYFPYNHSQVLYLIIKYISVFSIFFGSMYAVFQKNITKLIGYSSIAHMGFVIITLLLVEQYSIANESAIIYLINYLLSNIGMLSILSIANNLYNLKNNNSFYYQGFFWKKPILTIEMTILILSILGIPLTLGFISKFYIIFLSIYKNYWLINMVILINSGLGIYYYLKIILNFYSCSNKCDLNHHISFNLYKNLEMFIFLIIITIILLGIFPQALINIIHINNQLI